MAKESGVFRSPRRSIKPSESSSSNKIFSRSSLASQNYETRILIVLVEMFFFLIDKTKQEVLKKSVVIESASKVDGLRVTFQLELKALTIL